MNHFTWAAALTAALFLSCGETQAQSAFPEFSAKRVKPPKAGTGRRITVQVAPRAQPAVPPPPGAEMVMSVARTPTPAPQAATTTARYAWFWDTVSPDRSNASAARLDRALRALSSAPSGNAVPAPRLQAMQTIAAAHGTDILRQTVGTAVSPALVLAVIAVESSGRVDVTSGAGAQGLMQLMPATADRFGVTDAFDPADNISGGVAFLDLLLRKFEGDPVLALAGYNAGENAVVRANGVPDYPETRDYVPKVLAAFQTARGLCVTPPQLVSDGCVFRVTAGG